MMIYFSMDESAFVHTRSRPRYRVPCRRHVTTRSTGTNVMERGR